MNICFQMWTSNVFLFALEENNYHFFYLLRWAGLNIAASSLFRWLSVRVTVIILDNRAVIHSFADHLLFLETLRKREHNELKSSLPSNKLGMHSFPLWGINLTGSLLSFLFQKHLTVSLKRERSPGHYTAHLGKIIVLMFSNITFQVQKRNYWWF